MSKYIIVENNIIQNVVAADTPPTFLLKNGQTYHNITDITGSTNIGSIYYSESDSFIPFLAADSVSPPKNNYISGSIHIIQNFNSKINSTSENNIEIEGDVGNIINFTQNSNSRSIEFDFIPTSSIDSTIETSVAFNLINITNIVNSSLETTINYIHTGSLEGLNQD